ncbi:MAG: methylmalonyl-CoA mutase family protein [Cyclobacteriaceae bacterium]
MINLFDEFDPVTSEEWLKKATTDLKGENPLEKFKKELTSTIFQVPYYDSSDLADIRKISIADLLPDRPYDPWYTTEQIYVQSEKEANALALNALNTGANCLHFISDMQHPDLKALLKNIKLPYCYISFEKFEKELLSGYLRKALSESNTESLNISFLDSATKPEFDHKVAKSLHQHGIKDISLFVDQDHSSSLIKNLANQLSLFVDIICDKNDENVQNLYDRLTIVNTCRNHYFLEIAKLRAIRILFSEVGGYFDLKSPKVFIQSFTATGEDQLENLLINTTQAMSAVTGGTDALVITPHIKSPSDANEQNFTSRIARNVSNLLEEESHLDKVKDPSAGSYYICSLTDQLVARTWEKFKEIEELGGFSKLQERIA